MIGVLVLSLFATLAPLVETALSDENSHLRMRALAELSKLEDRAGVVAALTEGLQSGNPVSRWNAVIALSMFGSGAGLPLIHEATRSPDAVRRWEAINALGRVHDETSIRYLDAALGSPSAKDRGEAVLALGQIGGQEAIELLAAALEDPSSGVRWRAAMALGRAGNASVLPRLHELAQTDPDPQVRKHADRSERSIERKRL
jgi:hypothetical protein